METLYLYLYSSSPRSTLPTVSALTQRGVVQRGVVYYVIPLFGKRKKGLLHKFSFQK